MAFQKELLKFFVFWKFTNGHLKETWENLHLGELWEIWNLGEPGGASYGGTAGGKLRCTTSSIRTLYS